MRRCALLFLLPFLIYMFHGGGGSICFYFSDRDESVWRYDFWEVERERERETAGSGLQYISISKVHSFSETMSRIYALEIPSMLLAWSSFPRSIQRLPTPYIGRYKIVACTRSRPCITSAQISSTCHSISLDVCPKMHLLHRYRNLDVAYAAPSAEMAPMKRHTAMALGPSVS